MEDKKLEKGLTNVLEGLAKAWESDKSEEYIKGWNESQETGKDSLLVGIVDMIYPHGCCVDRSSHLFRQYEKAKKESNSGNLNEIAKFFDADMGDNYWQVNLGTSEQWFDIMRWAVNTRNCCAIGFKALMEIVKAKMESDHQTETGGQ